MGTVYCPRELCHTPIIPSDPESGVIVCPQCKYPFCKLCRGSWHGGGRGCRIKAEYVLANMADDRDTVVQKFLAADDDERRLMEAMYGVKILHKLVEAWNEQELNREYLRNNTVQPPQFDS